MRGKVRAGLPASGVWVGGPAGESGAAGGVRAGSLAEAPAPAPPVVKVAEGGGLGVGNLPP